MDRWDRVEATSIKENGCEFTVGEYTVNLSNPTCSCLDFKDRNWPCKHMLAIIMHCPSHTWDSLPTQYTKSPCFNLDKDCQSLDIVSEERSVVLSNDKLRDKCLTVLKEATNALYTVDSADILESVHNEVIKLKGIIEKGQYTGALREKERRNKRPTKRARMQMKQTEQIHSEQSEMEDEIDRVLFDIWDHPETREQILKVGSFTVWNNSFHFLKTMLPDEIMDAFLHLLCLPLDGSLHVASTVWTAIFLGQDPDKHRYLSEVQILEYDHLVGAVNEGGFHWSLIVVQPKDNKVLYINPMGEQNVSQQQILQHWIKFVHIRRSSSIDMGGPTHWNILCPRHAKQSDSISCGVYVLKVMESVICTSQ
ncbi:uncharacterized protein LOC127834853 [Dreissena polymorpha]|uniref:uncharacterized protein LOC127834853 n=1 Tax=Dreissena polymorpha TaxID=45954 RepID=UPI00226522C7|nr:uncharacterized protein LOC127834853 [Dreissena polymorpha]